MNESDHEILPFAPMEVFHVKAMKKRGKTDQNQGQMVEEFYGRFKWKMKKKKNGIRLRISISGTF